MVNLEKAVDQNKENEINVVQCRFYRSRSRDVEIYSRSEGESYLDKS